MNREEFLDWLVENKKEWPTIEQLDHIPLAASGWYFKESESIYTGINAAISIHDWNRAKIKPNTKIRIESSEHSKYVQKLAFEAGCKRADGKTAVMEEPIKYLYIYDDLSMVFGTDSRSFDLNGYKEIYIEMPKEQHPAKQSAEAISSFNAKVLAEKVGSKHSHYFKDVSDLDEVDVYRVCDLFEVDDASGATQHAIKKLLCSGKRGVKDKRKDLEEARDTIIRKLQIMDEDK